MTRDASKRLVSATQMSPVTESQLASGSDGIVDHQPSAANTTFAAVRFEHKEYNVTNYFEKFWIIPGIIPLCHAVWKSKFYGVTSDILVDFHIGVARSSRNCSWSPRKHTW